MESLALLHSLSTSTSFSLTSRNSLLHHSKPISKPHFLSPLHGTNLPFSKPQSLSYFPLKPVSVNPLVKPSITDRAIHFSSSPQTPNDPSPSYSSQSRSIPSIRGAKPIPLAISIGVGLVLRFLVPKPVDLSPQGWQLLSIFLSTIAGLVLSPLPVGAWAFLGLTVSIVTRTLTFSAAFSAFTNEVIWLIVISFFFARGFVKTGLGDRIATYFVKWLGRSTLGLSYGLTLSEALIAPAMPSTTARAGGVFLPIIKSLSLSAGSEPGTPSAKKLGSYLVQSQFQVNFRV